MFIGAEDEAGACSAEAVQDVLVNGRGVSRVETSGVIFAPDDGGSMRCSAAFGRDGVEFICGSVHSVGESCP